MTDDRLLDAFDDCLSRLKAGESIADCLRAYPELAVDDRRDLRSMLEAAQAAMMVSRVPQAAQMRSRAQFLTAAAQKKPQPAFAGWWRSLSTVAALAATAFIVWLGFSVVTNTVLNAATPTATPTLMVSPTHTLENTATVEPTRTTPAPTQTPSPTVTPLPPTATRTPTPTQPTATATATSQPTQLIAPMVETTPAPNVTDDHGGAETEEPGDDNGGDNSGSGSDDSSEEESEDDHGGGSNSGSGGGETSEDDNSGSGSGGDD